MPLLLAAALVTIRLYNYAGVPAADLDMARASADDAFRAAGISTTWIDCRVPNQANGAACTEPLSETGEFVMRLQRSHYDGRPTRVTLGSSLLDTRSGGGVLITLDPDLVARIAKEAGASSDTVLGHAMAHEVGHLLLGTSQHARQGLMRAVWSQHELRVDEPADWHFQLEEIARMQQTLAKRLRADGGLQTPDGGLRAPDSGLLARP